MKRNLVWILVAVSLCAWLKPPPLRARYEPNGPPLTVDGVGLNRTTAELDALLGPGVGSMQRAYRGGETVVDTYFDPRKGEFRSIAASGTVLLQGSQTLAKVGDVRRQVEDSLGPPTPNTWKDRPTALEIPAALCDAPGRVFYLGGEVRIQYRDDRVVEIYQSKMVSWLTHWSNQTPR